MTCLFLFLNPCLQELLKHYLMNIIKPLFKRTNIYEYFVIADSRDNFKHLDWHFLTIAETEMESDMRIVHPPLTPLPPYPPPHPSPSPPSFSLPPSLGGGGDKTDIFVNKDGAVEIFCKKFNYSVIFLVKRGNPLLLTMGVPNNYL